MAFERGARFGAQIMLELLEMDERMGGEKIIEKFVSG